MPILGGLIASALTWFSTLFAAQLGAKLAVAAGVIAVSAAGYVATKVALIAIITSLSAVAPPSIIAPIVYALPSNLAACVSAVFLSDAIHEAYRFWSGQLSHFAGSVAK